MSYVDRAELIKQPSFVDRVLVAVRYWAIAKLTGTPTDNQKYWGKTFIRGRDDSENTRTIVRAVVLANGYNDDLKTDDAALQSRVDTVVQIAIDEGVLVITDPDAGKVPPP